MAYPPALPPARSLSSSFQTAFVPLSPVRMSSIWERGREKEQRGRDGRTAEQCFHKGRNDVGRLHFQVAKVGKLGPDGNIFIVLHI